MAEIIDLDYDEPFTLGRAVAGLNAYSKLVAFGLFKPTPEAIKEQRQKLLKEETVAVDLLYRAMPARHTEKGLRVLSGDKPICPGSEKNIL